MLKSVEWLSSQKAISRHISIITESRSPSLVVPARRATLKRVVLTFTSGNIKGINHFTVKSVEKHLLRTGTSRFTCVVTMVKETSSVMFAIIDLSQRVI